jgi:hypothetical protein
MSEPVPAAPAPEDAVQPSATNETPVAATPAAAAGTETGTADAPDSPQAGPAFETSAAPGQPVPVNDAAVQADPRPESQAEMSDVGAAHTGVTNQSPQLPPNAAAGAAKAHALLSHLVEAAQQVQAELERYVPADAISAAEVEVKSMLRSIL